MENMAVVTVFVRIEEDREHQNRERVKSRRHVRELRLPARASQALVRELWRSGNKKRRKGIGCRKRQKIRRQARRAFNSTLAERLAGEWRRRRLRDSSARRLGKAWRQFKIKKAKQVEIAAEKLSRKSKVKASMMAGVGACPRHTGCFCVLWSGEWFAPPDNAENNNLAAVDRPRLNEQFRQPRQAKAGLKTVVLEDVPEFKSPLKGVESDEDGSPIQHRKKRKKKTKKKTKKGR